MDEGGVTGSRGGNWLYLQHGVDEFPEFTFKTIKNTRFWGGGDGFINAKTGRNMTHKGLSASAGWKHSRALPDIEAAILEALEKSGAMAIASTTVLTSRMNGGDPSNLTDYGQDNNSFTLSGSAPTARSSASRKIVDSNGGQEWSSHLLPAPTPWSLASSTKRHPLMAQSCFHWTTAPTRLQCSLPATIPPRWSVLPLPPRLTLTKATASFEPTPLMVRLTLAADGSAKLYIREIIEDDNGADLFLSGTGATGSSSQSSGATPTVMRNNVCERHGSVQPGRDVHLAVQTDSLLRMGMSMVQRLKDSKRFFLKNYVDDSSIVYGFDISGHDFTHRPTLHPPHPR